MAGRSLWGPFWEQLSNPELLKLYATRSLYVEGVLRASSLANTPKETQSEGRHLAIH